MFLCKTISPLLGGSYFGDVNCMFYLFKTILVTPLNKGYTCPLLESPLLYICFSCLERMM